MQKKNVVINLIVSFGTQIITLVLGMVLPRFILLAWGSEYNGLLTSVTNILRYLTLLEAGFNTSTLQALYKSVGQKDNELTSTIVCTSQWYYHRVSVLYAAIVCAIAFIYPLVIKSEIPYWEIVLIILLQGAVGVINFAFRASYQQLLNAEGKYYFISLVTLLTTVLTYTVKIIAIKIFNSVIVMQLLSVFVIIIQILIYSIYFDRRYKWIDKNAKPDPSLLQNRKYYFIQQIAGLVFNSTDTLILSVFCGLKVASVYAVYNLVFSALHQIVSIFRSSTNFVLGQSYHKDKIIFEKIYNIYSALQTVIGGVLSSICIVLIINFIKIYTSGVNDINYIDFVAAFIFSFNLILECSRGASLASANIAGKAPETAWHYVMEAVINIVASLIMVNNIGLHGVLLGTTLAGLYRTTDSVVYTNRKVLNRSAFQELGMIAVVYLLFFSFSFLANSVIKINAHSYYELLIYTLVTSICVISLYTAIFYILNRDNLSLFIRSLKK